MANIILIKRSAGSVAPTTEDLAKGQLGFTEGNEVLYYRLSGGDIIEIGGSGLGTSSGFLSKTQNLSGLTDLAAARTNIGLGNVTNNAQVKKITSSTIGNVPAWDVTTGDRFEDGYGVETTLVGSTTALARADAVKVYVDGILSANDAMIFKGTLGSGGTFTSLPLTHGVGWTIKVITAGTYAGKVAEIGDMYISLVSRSGSSNLSTDWAVVQANIDGAVTGPASATTNHVATFDGTSGKIIKSAGAVLGTGVLTLSTTGIATGNTTFGANQTTAGAFTVNVPGTNLTYSTAATTGTVNSSTGTNATIPAATTSLAGLMTCTDKTKLDGIAAGATTCTGTVISVAANAGTGISVTGSPITSAGTLCITNTSPNATHTGEVTGSAALTIANNCVSNAKLADMVTARIKGRATASTGDPEDLTAAQVRTLINVADGAQVNVATNLGITPGNTAGPIVTSSTGTNATLPTATGSNSGVITTGAQTIAGAKTFTSQVSAVSLNVFGKIIGGSATNTAAGVGAAVLGGSNNTASGNASNVAGGSTNIACGGCSNVAGGYGNTASGDCANVAGGYGNTASGNASNVAGGVGNTACGGCSNVAGGDSNIACGNYSNVAGGYGNTACGDSSVVAGGGNGYYSGNKACAACSGILGGTSNTVLSAHTNSFIIGSNLTSSAACHTFVNNLTAQGTMASLSTFTGLIDMSGGSILNAVIDSGTF